MRGAGHQSPSQGNGAREFLRERRGAGRSDGESAHSRPGCSAGVSPRPRSFARTRPVFFAEIGSVPHRDRSGGVAPGCRGHETGISARDRHFRASQRGRRRTHAEMSSSMCRGGAPVGLFLRGRRTGLLGQRPPGLTALFLRGRRIGPAPGPRRRRRTRTGMLTSAGLSAADPGGGGGHARNARVGGTTSAGGTTKRLAEPLTGRIRR